MTTPVVWITGAGSGIGRSVALKFAADGSLVALTARSRPALESLKEEIEANGGRAVTVPCDITLTSEINAAHAYIAQEIGSVDVLVNNAGISVFKSFLDTTIEEFDTIMNTNYRGAVAAAKAVLPAMLDQREGTIFNILSVTVRKIFPNSAAYAASKAACSTAMDFLREEVRGTGIRIINVIPGATDTAIWPEKVREKYRERMMAPDRVAETLLAIYHQSPDISIEEVILRPPGGDL